MRFAPPQENRARCRSDALLLILFYALWGISGFTTYWHSGGSEIERAAGFLALLFPALWLTLSGRLIRCFAASGNRFLTVRLEGEAGTVSLEIRDGTGSLQSAWYGVRSLDTRVPLRGGRRCTVHLRAADFRGSFFLALER